MDEYKQWLESKIDETDESLRYSLDIKRYGGAFWYSVKNDVYKECLAELEKENKQAKVVSFNDLEVGKRYVGVYITGGKSMVFAVTAKGCDDEGQYIWYGDTMEDTISFKGYACEYETVEYFEEVN